MQASRNGARRARRAMQAKLEVVVLERLPPGRGDARKMNRLVAGNGATTGISSVAMARSTAAAVAVAADTVEDDTGDATRGSKLAKPSTVAAADCACPATSSTSRTGRRRWTASSAAAPSPMAPVPAPSNRPLPTRRSGEIGAGRCLIGDAVKQRRAIGPAVEIEARRIRGSFMEGGVDIVGAAFSGTDAQPAAAKGGKQSERDRGLAGARTRRATRSAFVFPRITPPSQARAQQDREALPSPSRWRRWR